MDQTTGPEQIRDDIQHRRNQMSDDVNELEQRAKSMTDWQRHLEERPLIAVGVVATAGIFLGLMTGGSRDSDRKSNAQPYYYNYNNDGQQHDGRSFSGQATQAGRDQAASKVDEVRGALLSLAATKAQEFLREAVPGYQQEEKRVKQQSEETDRETTSGTDESHQPYSADHTSQSHETRTRS